MKYRRLIKPAADLFFAAAGLVLCLPLFMVLIPALSIVNRGRIFFLDERTGLRGRPFTMIKFRTMSDKTDGGADVERDRVTGLGRFLRRTSLDELPQLWNVLRRDMSFIGPRPLPVAYHSLFSPLELRRYDALPGMTGWAQVNGRHGIGWKKKFELDVYYVDRISFLLDLRIVLATAIVILSFKKDISLEEKPFTGN
jgi:undecaprenyl phosphate N,N'-diacetylbacillosamine 1-phosphate transferase